MPQDYDQQKTMSSDSNTNKKSPSLQSTSDYPVKTYYSTLVEQLHTKIDSIQNRTVYDFLYPTTTPNQSNDAPNEELTLSASASNTSVVSSDVKSTVKQNQSNSYSIDHILSKGSKNDLTPVSSSFDHHENPMPISINSHNNKANNPQLPSLELSSFNDSTKIYQPPLMYLSNKSNICGEQDSLESKSSAVGIGRSANSNAAITKLDNGNILCRIESRLKTEPILALSTGNCAIAKSIPTSLLDQSSPYNLPNLHSYHQSTTDVGHSFTPNNGVYTPMQSMMCEPTLSTNTTQATNFPSVGQSLKVTSSFHQMNLVNNSTGTTIAVSENLPTNNQSNEPVSLPIEEQFKPMDCGFERVIARSKYGAETKVLKKFVVYVAPESAGGCELRSKRDVSRFLKSQPEGCNFKMTPENFNFDNTIHFNMETRTIGKVPRLKKNCKPTELITETPAPTSNDIQQQNYNLTENLSINELDDKSNRSYTPNNGDDLFLNPANPNGELDSSLLTAATFNANHPFKYMITKKRGRPKGAISKTPYKAKRLRLINDLNEDESILQSGDVGKPQRSALLGGRSSLAKAKCMSKPKRFNPLVSRERIGNGPGNKYVKLPKQAFDDLTIEQPKDLPMGTSLLLDEVVSLAMISMSEEEVCITLSNLISVYEFIQEFFPLFPLMNRLSVFPPFFHVVSDILTIIQTNNDTDENRDVIMLVNSPFLCLCECLLETYLNQKLPLPSVCYDMKVEFDVSQKFNNINICTIIRLFIEDHLDNISHLKYATSLGYNKDLKTLVQTLRTTTTICELSPLLKSTVLLFLINLLNKSPCFLTNVEKIIDDFIVTRSAKWNVESLIRKLKRHIASIKPKVNSPTKIKEENNSLITVTNAINETNEKQEQLPANDTDCTVEPTTESPQSIINQNFQPNTANDEHVEKTSLKTSKNASIDIEDQEDNSVAFEEEDEEEYDDHNSSKKFSRNKSNAFNGGTVVNISDESLLEAIQFDTQSIKLSNNLEECKKLAASLENKQRILKDWSFAFFRRLKGLSMGQDRFSRYYSIPYHSSCVFVEHNPRELELDNFINNLSPLSPDQDDSHQSCKYSNNPTVVPSPTTEQNGIVDTNFGATEVKQETSTLENCFVEPSIVDNKQNNDADVTKPHSNPDECVTTSPSLNQPNRLVPLMFFENFRESQTLLKSLNILGMRERLLSKNFNRHIKNMSENTLAQCKFYQDLSQSLNIDESFCAVQPNPLVEKYYNVSIDQIVYLQYNQFVDFIRAGNVFSDEELASIHLPSDLRGVEFVTYVKSTLVKLIHLLDTKGLIALVKKAKTNSREAKSRYTKSLIDFIEGIGDVCYDFELVLTSLQLNVSFESIGSNVNNNNNNTSVTLPLLSSSPFHNKCCYDCHLNVNFDSLITCMYCYTSYHSYCQGYQEDPSQIDQEKWSCNHCKSLVCVEAIENSFTVCRECSTNVYQNPPREMSECEMLSESEDNLGVDATTKYVDNEASINATDNASEVADENPIEPIRCSLCLYYYHRQCVYEMDSKESNTNDVYICPSCSDACRFSKAVAESGRKRISKKFKMDICDMFAPCHIILHELYEHPCAEDFTKPVDLNKYPLYLRFIKKPIDLQQIDQHLKALEYKDRDEFITDVRLIFENCKRFNQCDSEIYVAGRKMSYFFENRCVSLFFNSSDNADAQQ